MRGTGEGISRNQQLPHNHSLVNPLIAWATWVSKPSYGLKCLLRSSLSHIVPNLAPQPPRIHYSNQVVTQLKKRQVLEATIGDELTVLTGLNVAITCPTSGLPFPTIQWRKDDKDLSFNGTTFKIKNVTTQDSGVFTCEATNRAGKISHSSEFRVIGKHPKYTPLPPAPHF